MKKLIGILFVILALSQIVFADVISVKETAKLAKKGEVIIVSARSNSDYAKKHIKGAVNIYHKDLYKSDGISSMLKSPVKIAEIFGNQGIKSDSKIVIYDDGDNKLAGRLYWIFKYMGATDVNILDGHIKGWMKGRKPITKSATNISAVIFSKNIKSSEIATMKYVKDNLDKITLVDVRSADEYNGKNNDDENIKRPGHIPEAIHFEYNNVVNDDGTIKSKEKIAKLVKDAGIKSDKEIVLYCASSVRAGIVYVALTDVLNFSKVRVYDGAYYEWSNSSNSIK
ncbi:MAG: sulfurtransferase [Candidatus Marinimicrobia bacterium]|nr:sulfurtransferase [Candidatus Neomarinimicrobiota bacterium]